MQFLIVLLVASLVAWALPARFGGRSVRYAMRHGLAVGLVFTGVSHFLMPESFLVYFPSWVPFPELIIYASGLVEIVGALALFVRRYRAQVGLALAAYFVLVFPGNVYAAVAGGEESLPGLIEAAWYPWVRLPFQALFVWWALGSTRPAAPAGRPTRALRMLGATR